MIDEFGLMPDDPVFDAAVEALYATAFGPGRHAKAAARLRESNRCRRDLSWIAVTDGAVIGACRLWPIRTDQGQHLLFLGPIAVSSHAQGQGLGAHLVRACLKSCDEKSGLAVVLVGDLAYFEPFGFVQATAGSIMMPGPVDPARLLIRMLGPSEAPRGKLMVP
ncbi:hypothetical protein PbB2_02588 [Candidatus Phycosocius bacilliformis]|uniref:N-acetyltransferase domain-containing protein n=1 Tax=Candidatus Phycosocius bacilliformis TaxID=1445552 RepID=A0A2P2ECV0_9PROT|nr:N-acetyltransferase [Candidatus Phycosocius bacilliformis]GBF58898.1 hypothetical protein PbB2_02588 [Candidatus Phycosocius bacilliformis]